MSEQMNPDDRSHVGTTDQIQPLLASEGAEAQGEDQAEVSRGLRRRDLSSHPSPDAQPPQPPAFLPISASSQGFKETSVFQPGSGAPTAAPCSSHSPSRLH